VYEALDQREKRVVAVKLSVWDEDEETRLITNESLEQERDVLMQLSQSKDPRSTYVVKIFHMVKCDTQVALILECCDCTLHTLIKRGFSIKRTMRYMKHLLHALSFLEDEGIYHFDVKPANILLKNDVAKLCDFGLACRKGDEIDPTIVCSPNYRALEVELGGRITEKVDIWSLAATCYEMRTGTVLFPGNKMRQVLKQIYHTCGYPSRSFEEICPSFVYKQRVRTPRISMETFVGNRDLGHLLTQMLNLNWQERLSAKEALTHPFLDTEMSPKLGKAIKTRKRLRVT